MIAFASHLRATSLNLFSGHIEFVLCFIILKRPNTDSLFGIVVDGAVLGHRSTCYLGIWALYGTLEDHQGGVLGHHCPAVLSEPIKLAGDGHKAMIAMAISEMVERLAVFIYHCNGFLTERSRFVIILHVVGAKVEVCNYIGVDHRNDAVSAFDQGIVILSI